MAALRLYLKHLLRTMYNQIL